MGVDPRSATFVSCFFYNLGEVLHEAYDTLLRTCPPSRITPLRRTCWGPFGLAQLLGGERRSRGDRPTGVPRFCPTSLGWRRSRSDRPSRGFGPVAGTWCRFSPRNRVTKSRTRRCQRTISFPWSSGTRMIIPHSLCRKQAGIAVFGNCARLHPSNVHVNEAAASLLIWQRFHRRCEDYISLSLIFLRMLRLKSRGPPKNRISDCVIGMP